MIKIINPLHTCKCNNTYIAICEWFGANYQFPGNISRFSRNSEANTLEFLKILTKCFFGTTSIVVFVTALNFCCEKVNTNNSLNFRDKVKLRKQKHMLTGHDYLQMLSGICWNTWDFPIFIIINSSIFPC